MAGSEKALEFLGNRTLYQEIKRRLPADSAPYFEALIRTQTVNGVAGESAIVACRPIRHGRRTARFYE